MSYQAKILTVLAMMLVGFQPALIAATESSSIETPNIESLDEGFVFESVDTDLFNPNKIVLKFKDGSNVQIGVEKLVSTTSNTNLTTANAVLASYPEIEVKQKIDPNNEVINSRLREVLAPDKLSVANRMMASELSQYFDVSLPETYSQEDAQKLVHRLNQLDEVETAYIQPIPVPASIDLSPTTPNFNGSQDYLDNNNTGMYARWAWTQPGGFGDNVRYTDVEGGWTLNHEDLDEDNSDLVWGYSNTGWGGDATWRDHGTASLGLTGALDNAYGITGIAPNADHKVSSIFDVNGDPMSYDVYYAIFFAALFSDANDVVLLELQYGGPNGGAFVPVEYYASEFDVIQFATETLGVHVVQAAGNGGQNLDDSTFYGSNFDRDYRDSGAILVGAGCPPGYTLEGCGTTGARGPLSFSNYGSRVDVQGWGINVVATGYGGLFNGGGDVRQHYTSTFSGTSSGSALVAGAATSLAGMIEAQGLYFTPLQFRDILTNTGTPQATSTKNVGPLPNLQAAMDAVYYIDANFTADITEGKEALTVRFTDQSVYNQATSWLWEFGDGNTSTERNPVHTYNVAGQMTVKLTVSNNGNSNTETKTNYINALPKFWTDWDMNGGKTSAPIATQEFGGRLYQAIRGNSSPYYLYIRSTADGTYDGYNTVANQPDSSENWNRDIIGGKTSAEPEMAVYQPSEGPHAGQFRLYITVRGNSGAIFTKSMAPDGTWDSEWNENGGLTGAAIGMQSYTPTTGPNAGNTVMYQAIKGYSTNSLYTRYTNDGIFDGDEPGESWFKIWGRSPNPPALAEFNGKLVMSVRGDSGEIWSRYTTDGVFDDNPSSELFNQNGGKTSDTPTLAVFDGKLFQSIKGNSTNKIYWRTISDLSNWNNWTAWEEEGGRTPNRIGLGTFSVTGKLYQSVRGESGEIFIRTNKY